MKNLKRMAIYTMNNLANSNIHNSNNNLNDFDSIFIKP